MIFSSRGLFFSAKMLGFTGAKPRMYRINWKFPRGRRTTRWGGNAYLSILSNRTLRMLAAAAGLACLIVGGCLSSLPARAQECTSYVVVSAFDRKTGDDIDNLNAGDFEAMLGKHDAAVVSATQKFTDRLLVLLQTDGTSNDRIEDVVDLATRMARQAPEGKKLAFGVFVKKAAFTKGFITEQKSRALAISGLREDEPDLGKEVHLYNALHEALRVFGQHEPGDAVLVITDGYDDGSDHSGVEVRDEYLKTGTRLFVALRRTPSHVSGNFTWRSPEPLIHFVQKMSETTGGIYTLFSARDFSFAWEGYLLGIQTPNGVSPKHHKLKVRLQGAAALEHKRVNLYFPERLPDCGSESTTASRQNAPVNTPSSDPQ